MDNLSAQPKVCVLSGFVGYLWKTTAAEFPSASALVQFVNVNVSPRGHDQLIFAILVTNMLFSPQTAAPPTLSRSPSSARFSISIG